MQNQNNLGISKHLFKLLLSFIILFSFTANSQVIVTDLIPDTIVNDNEIYFLDLNNDGTPDFKFVHEDSVSGLNGMELELQFFILMQNLWVICQQWILLIIILIN